MRNFKCLLLAATLAVAGLSNLVAAPAMETDDSFTPKRWGTLPLFSSTIPTVGITNPVVGANPIRVLPGVLVIQPSCVATQASTSNVVFKARTSIDGITWSSTFLSSPTMALTGLTTNTVSLVIGTNIAARWISFDAATSAELGTTFVGPVSYAFLAAQSSSPSP